MNLSRLFAAFFIFTWQIFTPVFAADFYWDADLNPANNNIDGTGLGGTGIWDTSLLNWWDLSTDGAWTNTAVDEAIFTGPFALAPAPSTVTLSGPLTANALSFLRSGYTLTGGDITLAGTDPGLFAAMGETATIDTQLLGSAGLVKTGGGSIRLTNILNGYTGTTSIQNGALIITNGAALGGTGAVNITSGNNTPLNGNLVGFVGGSLVLDGTTSGFTFARDINFEGRGPLGDRSSAILSLGNNTLSGVLNSSVSPLPLSPTASFRNSRVNSVNGTLSIAGTLNVGGAPVALGTSGATTGTFTTLGGINTAGTGNFNLNGTLAGASFLEKNGAGTLFLNPASTSGFTGSIRIGTSATGQQSSVRVTQTTAGGTSVFGASTANEDASAIDLNGGVLEFRSDSSLNFNALASGKNVYNRASSILYTGPGAGGSAVNGTTTLGLFRMAQSANPTFRSRNGFGTTLQAWTQETTGGDNTITNDMGGTLLFTGDAWNNNDGSARTLNFGGNGNTRVAGNITASGTSKALTKTGSGELILNGVAGTLTGAVNIQGGAIRITDFRSVNNNTVAISLGNAGTTGGTLIIGGTGVSAGTAAGLTTSKPITLNTTSGSNSIYANQSGTNPVILNGAITKIAGATTGNLILGGLNTADNIINVPIPVETTPSTGGLVKVGAGTWVLNAANTYLGTTTLSQGTLKLRANGAVSTVLPSTNDITFAQTNSFSGATLELVGQAAVNNVQALDVLTSTSGMNTIRLTPGAGGTASLSFNSLAAPAGASGLNIVGASATNQLTITGANGLVDRAVYFGGGDFAFRDTNVLRAPVYGTDSGFVTSATTLAAGNNQITGSFATNNVSVNTLKINGAQALTINAGQTLTLAGGGLLSTGGNASIAGGTLALGGQTLSTRVNTNQLTISSAITGSGGLTKNGPGTLIMASTTAAQTGLVSINEGTVQLSGAGSRLGAAADLVIRQAGTLDLNGVTPGTSTNAFTNNGVVTSVAPATFTVGGGTGAGTSFGIITGAVSMTKTGTGAQSWLGSSTYTGVTTIGSTGTVTVNTLANGGVASGIGASTNAASNLVFTGTTGGLIYQGNILDGDLTLGSRSASTDRLFTLAAASTGATLSSTVSNNNAIVWSNTGAIVNNTTAAATLILTGTSAGDNTFNPQLVNSAAVLNVNKTGGGQWNLGNTNNTYTGLTTITDGILGLNDAGSLPTNSPLVLGATTTSGILQTTGTFARNLAATATAGTGTITWGGTTGGGGFSAHAGPLTVTLNGGTGLTWGSGGFVGTGGVQSLILNSGSSLADVNFTNDIDLGALVRTVTVNDNPNTGAEYASLSGVLSGTGGGLLKSGGGILRLGNANTYTGTTSVDNGTLVVSSLGNSTGGLTSSVGAGGVTMDDSNAIVLGNATTTGGILQYVGAGETSDRKIRLRGNSAANQIHADGSGALVLSNVAHDTTETGNKTLLLRGTNTGSNMITSTLTNNGAGVLTVSVDGGASWILTNSGNSHTGGTSVSSGALGIGNSTVLGTGTLTVSNGNIFAYGSDRTITNAVTLANNASNGWIGDYNVIVNSVTNMGATDGNVTTNNSIGSGKSLAFNNGVTANVLTANRAWILNGPGETIVNGDFTTSTAFGVRIDVFGGGTLSLGTNGASSNWNKTITAADIDRGTLKFTANEAIPTAAATSGGVTLTPELATADTAIVDLNGTTQTFNAFTANSDGTSIITNSSVGAATLIVGANNTTTTFGTGGTGTYSITQPNGMIHLGKIGTGTANFTGTLGNTGTVTSSGGTLNINSATIATGAVANGGTVNFKGGFTTPSTLTTVTTDNGGLVSFADGIGTPFNNLTSLSLSMTANSGLEFDVGDSGIDTLTTLNAATVNNLTTLFIKDVDITSGGTYNLLVDANGGLGTSANYALNLPGYSGSTLSVTPNLVQLIAGTLVTSNVYWNNGTGVGGGTLTSAWNTVDGVTTNINFASDEPGLTTLMTNANLPGKGQKVIFQADSISGGTPLATNLEQSFTVNALDFRPSATPADTSRTISIAPGTVSSNSLTVRPSLATDGINLQSGAAGTVTISAPFVAGTDQTWTVADAPVELFAGVISGTTNVAASTAFLRAGMTVTGTGITAGTTIATIVDPGNFTLSQAATNGTVNLLAAQQLNMSGVLSGPGNVVKAGAGKVVLSGASGTLAGTYTNNAGITEVTVLSALAGSVGAPGSGADITVTGGAFYYSNATGGTFVNDIVLNGGTLSAGGANHTYSGNINVAANSTINMRDQVGGTTFTTAARSITMSGLVSGSAGINVDSVTTSGGGNQITGNLVFNNAASTWNGALNMTRGGVFFQNVAGSGNLTPYFGYDGIINFNQFGRVTYRNLDGQTLNRTSAINVASSAIGELSIDNLGALATNYVVNQQGAVNLNGGSLRATIDDGSELNLTGGVVLNGNSSITVQGSNQADNILTISGTGISGNGNLAINDEAGGWGVTSRTIQINAPGTFVGNSSLNEGTLILGNAAALNGTGNFTITGASTIQAGTDLSGANSVANPTTLSAALTVSGINNLELSGAFTGTGVDAAQTLTNNITGPAALTISGGVNLVGPLVVNTAARNLTIAGTGATTISGVIADGNALFANGLNVTNTAITTINGANTYSGTTTMNAAAGTLRLLGSNSSAGATTLTTGTIQLDSAANNGLASGTLTLAGGTLQPLNVDRTISNVVVMAGNSTMSGAQNLTFSNSVTNSGGNRTLTNSLTTPSKLTLASDVNLSEIATTGRTLTIAGVGNTDITGVIQNFNGSGLAGGLAKTGAGTLTISNTNTYTGTTSINAGTGVHGGVLAATANNALGTGAVSALFSTGALSGQITLSGGITLGNSGFTTTGAGTDGTVDGLIRSVSGANTITGSFTMTSGGGSTTFRADTSASLALNGAITANTPTRFVTLTGGGQFSFGATGSINNSGASTVGLWSTNSGITTINSVSNTYTLTTGIGNGNTLVIADLSNGGASSSIGAAAVAATNLVIDDGTLRYTGSTGAQSTNRLFSIGDGGAVLDASGATAADTMSFTGTGALGFHGIAGIGNAAVENGPRTLSLTGSNTGSNTLASIIGDQAAVTGVTNVAKTGSGNWVLSGANTYTGTTTVGAGGTLVAGSAQAFGVNSAVSVASTGTIQLAGNSVSIGSLAGAGLVENANATPATLTVGGDNTTTTFTGLIQDGIGGGALSLQKVGTGILILTNVNTFTGSNSVAPGSTQVAGSTQAFGINSAITVTGGLQLAGFSNSIGSLAGSGTVENANAAAATLTTGGNNTNTLFSGVIQDGFGGGALSLVKNGTGTLDITGTNTYTGPTSVTGGTLLVNNAAGSGTGTGTVSVGNGATLGGSGSIDGATTFLIGSTHSPGNSPGIQTFAGAVNYNTGSALTWDLIANSESGRGVSFDGVDVGGVLTIDTGVTSNLVFNSAGSSVQWSDPFWDINRQWLVFDNTTNPTVIGGVFGTVNVGVDSAAQSLLASRGSFSWSVGGNDVLLNYTAVAIPEPGTMGALGLAGLIYAAARRRRAKRQSQATAAQ